MIKVALTMDIEPDVGKQNLRFGVSIDMLGLRSRDIIKRVGKHS